MELKEAIQILKAHNSWRRFDGEEPYEELPIGYSQQLGIAIDTVVKEYETQKQL